MRRCPRAPLRRRERVRTPIRLGPALGAAIASGRPTVIDVVIESGGVPADHRVRDALRAGAPVPVSAH
jgi:thiamine pyrophosphate-dependent acetolactate synthase large subunit-like protein